ncbi:MAG: hypothetical protein FWC41_01385 [Firmicutes bacterium]|nr:hypothetical protein [Bacillota bacterium]
MINKTDPFEKIKNARVFHNADVTVLFFDVVGFTKGTDNESMKNMVRSLEDCISDLLWNDYNWDEDDKENHLILIPTGDGYAVGFHPIAFNHEQILKITLDLFKLIKNKNIPIRMGLAKGPVIIHNDLNERNNIFGYGINIASRVMTVAQQNQILIHEDLASEINRVKKNALIGKICFEQKIKHGEKIKVYEIVNN